MNKLPNVSAFPINKNLRNSQETFHNNSINTSFERNANVPKKIKEIFSSTSHIYKSRARIKINGDYLEKTIIGKTSDSLLTLDGQKIRISEILDIEKI